MAILPLNLVFKPNRLKTWSSFQLVPSVPEVICTTLVNDCRLASGNELGHESRGLARLDLLNTAHYQLARLLLLWRLCLAGIVSFQDFLYVALTIITIVIFIIMTLRLLTLVDGTDFDEVILAHDFKGLAELVPIHKIDLNRFD